MWLGKSQGNWLGSWDGAVGSADPGSISAALSGAGILTAVASAAIYLSAGLTGSGDLIGQLTSGEGPQVQDWLTLAFRRHIR